MARELIPHNVTLNTVCPGLYDTDALHTNLHGHAKRLNTTYEAMVEDRDTRLPGGTVRRPEGMRRPRRVSLQRAVGLHDGAEHRQRWRCLSGAVLMADDLLAPGGRVVMISGASRGIGAAVGAAAL